MRTDLYPAGQELRNTKIRFREACIRAAIHQFQASRDPRSYLYASRLWSDRIVADANQAKADASLKEMKEDMKAK
jgi:hypothetical protein